MEGFGINRIKLLLLTFLILTLSSIIGAAAEVHPGDSIQAAVNNSNPNGDTIIVYPGTYNENIVITKNSNLVLMSASEIDETITDDTIITPKDINKSVISATSRNLVIKGFTISGAATDLSGIYLSSSRDCTIENNKFVNDALGVYVENSVNTTIRNNSATRTSEAGKIGRGINIEGSESTIVSNNTVSNHRFGIYLSESRLSTISVNSVSQSDTDSIVLEKSSNNNVLKSNIVKSNARYGISLSDSNSNSLIGNKVSNGTNGINLVTSPENIISGTLSRNNTISGNIVDFSSQHNIMLDNTSNNNITGNTVSSSQYGIAVRSSHNNRLTDNNAYNNSVGLYITLTSSENTVSGNKADSNRGSGISLYRVSDNIVENNEANSNTNQGILLDNSSSNQVINNSASKNARGIYVSSSSSRNILSENTANSNSGSSGIGADGILLENSSDNDVINNIVNMNGRNGVYVASSNNSDLINNTAQNNKIGISLSGSLNSVISENRVIDCTDSGLYLTISSNNTISKNIAYGNGEGISLDSSENNEISSNNVSSNGNGIYMCPRSYGNRAYDNYFNNIESNGNIKNNRSFWNTDKKSGKNIMSGPNFGGNFWGTPAGLGFSDTNLDNDSDGIIDIPFVSNNGITASANGNITDNYPLIRVVLPVAKFDANPTEGLIPLAVQFTDRSQDATSISWDLDGDGVSDNTNKSFVHVYEKPGTYIVNLTASNKNGINSMTMQIIAKEFLIYPVADFSANVTSGYAPLSVLFTDKSQNATSRNWDIGNDGTVESTNASFVYVFTNPGTYPVSLTAKNENGTSPAKTATITVTTEESSSSGGGSHHSGGGGGGAGGSPEPQTNVQVKELSKAQVTNGKPVLFDFTNNATCVVYVGFDAKKTAGKITTIAEQLKAKSTLVSVLDSGEVYKYFNLWVGNSGFATEKNIENPVVCFKVEKSWLQDKKINQSSITLNRYNDKKWSQIPVKLLKEDSKYLYFTAETPGFSFFAITGKAVEKIAEAKPSTNTSKLEKNSTASKTEPEQKPEQETGKDKTSSIPGFEALYVVACLVMVFLHRRK